MHSINSVTNEQLLAEIESIVRTAPERNVLRLSGPEAWTWLGRAKAALRMWNLAETVTLDTTLTYLQNSDNRVSANGYRDLMTLLSQAHNDLRMRSIGPVNLAIGQGMTFSYFDELRKLIELANSDLLFVDAYMNADFVSKYLPHVKAKVKVRLLGKQYLPALVSAADAFRQQHSLDLEIRSSSALHDRFIFVDRAACYISGASFKDGAKNAGTVLSQITDAFTDLHVHYEQLWTTGQIELQ